VPRSSAAILPSRPHRLAAALGLLLAASAAAWAAAPSPSPPEPAAELEALRPQAVAAAQAVQRWEATVAALEHTLLLLGREVAGRQRGLDDSRAEQAQLLGIIEHLARHPPNQPVSLAQSPIDRRRSAILLDAAVPELRAEAHALADEIGRLATLRVRVGATQDELATTRDALSREREKLGQITARRQELLRQILRDDGDGERLAARLSHDAGDLAELIKRAEADLDRRDKELLARARAALPKAKANALTLAAADPTRPPGLRAIEAAQGVMLLPVVGTIARQYGQADTAGTTSEGISVTTIPLAAAVAPFDGRVIYAGPFRSYGLILILRHGGGYHSLLAGLGRVDASIGQWIVAGEPVGAMPDAAASGGGFYFELRRDGRPVDPQPWLAKRDGVVERGD
jgi:murein hydrolase activator